MKRLWQAVRDITPDSFAPNGGAHVFDADRGEEPSRAAPRREAAAASTPMGSAVRIDYLKTGKTYLFLDYIAGICGIDAHELHFRFRPNHWGCPGHWILSAGRTCYAEAALPELARELEELGAGTAAAKLRDLISTGRGGTATAEGLESLRTTAAPASDPWYRKGALA